MRFVSINWEYVTNFRIALVFLFILAFSYALELIKDGSFESGTTYWNPSYGSYGSGYIGNNANPSPFFGNSALICPIKKSGVDGIIQSYDIIAGQVVQFPSGGSAVFSYTYYYPSGQVNGTINLWVDTLASGNVNVC